MSTVAPVAMPYGPLMIDIAGTSLSDVDRRRLLHPLVGGLILFGRNYESPEQLSLLTAEVHALRQPSLPITIDHEGGRVQRCRAGFTRLPAMRQLGELWAENPEQGISAAAAIGFVLATELRMCGVDFSYTPVLDLDWGHSRVVGDRSFGRDPALVIALADALIAGLRAAGMGCCGKHFPGHGWAEADSHVAIPIDERTFEEIATDMTPYRHLALTGIMPAHVIYPQVDSRPAGFSPVWIGKLRNDLGFDGVIFSDDLSMAGAGVVGDVVARVEAAWQAGCDMLLVCNAPDAVDEVLTRWRYNVDPVRAARVGTLLPQGDWRQLLDDPRYAAGREWANRLTVA